MKNVKLIRLKKMELNNRKMKNHLPSPPNRVIYIMPQRSGNYFYCPQDSDVGNYWIIE